MLNILAEFEGDRSAERGRAVAGRWMWCGGEVVAVAVAHGLPCHWPVGPPLCHVGLLALSCC